MGKTLVLSDKEGEIEGQKGYIHIKEGKYEEIREKTGHIQNWGDIEVLILDIKDIKEDFEAGIYEIYLKNEDLRVYFTGERTKFTDLVGGIKLESDIRTWMEDSKGRKIIWEGEMILRGKRDSLKKFRIIGEGEEMEGILVEEGIIDRPVYLRIRGVMKLETIWKDEIQAGIPDEYVLLCRIGGIYMVLEKSMVIYSLEGEGIPIERIDLKGEEEDYMEERAYLEKEEKKIGPRKFPCRIEVEGKLDEPKEKKDQEEIYRENKRRFTKCILLTLKRYGYRSNQTDFSKTAKAIFQISMILCKHKIGYQTINNKEIIEIVENNMRFLKK